MKPLLLALGIFAATMALGGAYEIGLRLHELAP